MRDPNTGRFRKGIVLPTEDIINLYIRDQLSANKIAKHYGVCQMRILNLLKEAGVERRPSNNRIYKLNEDYFSEWTNSSAYIVGFLTADGYIYKPKIRIHLQERDISVLEFINKELCSNAPIRTYIDDRPRYKDNKILIHKSLAVYSNKLCDQLAQYNIIQNKTGREKLPNIPEKYRATYILGLFDGDGCVHFSQHRRNNRNYIRTDYYFNIVSASKQFLLDIKDMVNLGSITKVKDIYRWGIYNMNDLVTMYHYLYNDPPFYLTRKKEIFDKIINYAKIRSS